MTEPRSRRTFPDSAAKAFRAHAAAMRKLGATKVTATSGAMTFEACWETPPDKASAIGFGLDRGEGYED